MIAGNRSRQSLADRLKAVFRHTDAIAVISIPPTEPGRVSSPAHLWEGKPVVDEAWLDRQVQQERLRQHMRGHALTATSGFLPIAYLTWLLFTAVPHHQLLVWALTLTIVDVVVVAHALWYLRRDLTHTKVVAWRIRQIGLQTLAGLIWGSAGAWTGLSAGVRTDVLVVLVAVMSIGVIGLIHYHLAVISGSSRSCRPWCQVPESNGN